MARLMGEAVAKAELYNTVHLCSNQGCTVDFTPKIGPSCFDFCLCTYIYDCFPVHFIKLYLELTIKYYVHMQDYSSTRQKILLFQFILLSCIWSCKLSTTYARLF